MTQEPDEIAQAYRQGYEDGQDKCAYALVAQEAQINNLEETAKYLPRLLEALQSALGTGHKPWVQSARALVDEVQVFLKGGDA